MSETRRSEEWEAKRRQILDVAAELFAEKGFAGGTTRDIAQRVGLTQPAIYYYVGSKDDLMSMLAAGVDEAFYGKVEAAIESTTEPIERMRAVIHAFVDAMNLHHGVIGLRFTESRLLPKPVAATLEEDERRFVRLFEGAVRDAMAAGALASDRPPHVVSLGILGMLSWMFRWYSPEAFDPTEVADTFCDLLGLRA